VEGRPQRADDPLPYAIYAKKTNLAPAELWRDRNGWGRGRRLYLTKKTPAPGENVEGQNVRDQVLPEGPGNPSRGRSANGVRRGRVCRVGAGAAICPHPYPRPGADRAPQGSVVVGFSPGDPCDPAPRCRFSLRRSGGGQRRAVQGYVQSRVEHVQGHAQGRVSTPGQGHDKQRYGVLRCGHDPRACPGHSPRP